MADDIDTVPADSGDGETDLRQLAAEMDAEQQERAANPPVAEPARRAVDDGTTKVPADDKDVSWRQAAKSYTAWRAQEQERARQYAELAGTGPLAGELRPAIQGEVAELAARFPDIRSQADLDRVFASDPERARAFAQVQASLAQKVGRLEQAAGDSDLDAQAQAAQQEIQRQAQAQAQAETQHINNLSDAEQHLKWTLNQEVLRLHQGYGDIRGPEDLEHLRLTDPVRHATFLDHLGRYQRGQQVLQQVQQERHAAGKQEFERSASENDAYWMAQHPELQDPAKLAHVAENAQAVLEDIGLTGEDFRKLWNGESTIALRDWRVQEVLHMAAMYKSGQRALEQARTNNRSNKQIAAVQRPGVAQVVDHGHEKVEALRRRFERATGNLQMRIGAELMDAEARLARRGQ